MVLLKRVLRGLVLLTVLPAAGELPVPGEPHPPPGLTAEQRAEIVGQAEGLEERIFDLFVNLSRDPDASDSLLLHSHNVVGAARSFAHIARQEGTFEFLTLSHSLLKREAELLEPHLAGHAAAWQPVMAKIASLGLALDRLRSDSPEDGQDEDRPRIELENTRWHGNMLDRFVRIRGRLSGVTLEECDVVITDSENRVVSELNDHVKEIDAFYRRDPDTREQRSTIPFSARFSADLLAEGENFITFRLRDARGRRAVNTVTIGK